MKPLNRYSAVALLTLVAGLASAAYDVRMVGIVFDDGADTAELSDSITGDESVMYRFRAKDGQRLRVVLRPGNDNTHFILYAPGKWPGEVRHDSERGDGYEFDGRIDRDGFHAVTVFQEPDASRAGRRASYELVITLEDRAE